MFGKGWQCLVGKDLDRPRTSLSVPVSSDCPNCRCSHTSSIRSGTFSSVPSRPATTPRRLSLVLARRNTRLIVGLHTLTLPYPRFSHQSHWPIMTFSNPGHFLPNNSRFSFTFLLSFNIWNLSIFLSLSLLSHSLSLDMPLILISIIFYTYSNIVSPSFQCIYITFFTYVTSMYICNTLIYLDVLSFTFG